MVKLSDLKRGDLLLNEDTQRMYFVGNNPEQGLFVWFGLMDAYLADFTDADGNLSGRYENHTHIDMEKRFAEISPDDEMLDRAAEFNSDEIEGLELVEDPLRVMLIDDQGQILQSFYFLTLGEETARAAADKALKDQKDFWIKSGCIQLENYDRTGKSDADYSPLIVPVGRGL